MQEDANPLPASGVINSTSYNFSIGRAGEDGEADPRYYNGHIDEFRFTKGVARWTSNFTPPTSSNLGTIQGGFIKTVDAGLTQSYTYTEADHIIDNGVLSNDVTFRVYTKSIYGRSRDYAEKEITIIN